MRHIRLLLEYDGTAYHGWQSQPSARTIQDVLEERIRRITGEPSRTTAASRTDAGVHALGQVAVLPTGSRLSADVILRALNATLPADIRVLAADEVAPAFHPRYDAVKKAYSYFLQIDAKPSVFLHRYTWHLRRRLDVAAMAESAGALLGSHDFSTFRGAGCGAKTPLRHVSLLEVTEESAMQFLTFSLRGRFVRVRIEANAFLRHMARNIVGTLVAVGIGDLPPGAMQEILLLRDRAAAGPTAPARGLFLERVTY